MKGSTASRIFIGVGATLAVVAGVGLAFDVLPNLPDFVLKILLYKMTFLAAAGLIAFGAILGRRYGDRPPHASDDPNALKPPLPQAPVAPSRQPESSKVDYRDFYSR